MEVTLTRVGAITIVAVKGRIDASNASTFDSICEQLIVNNELNVLVDCKLLDYISSAGLRVLLKMAKQLKKLSGKLTLAHLNPYVQQIFEIAGFLTLFPAFPNVTEALNHLSPKKS